LDWVVLRSSISLLARLVFNNLRAFDVVPVVTESLVMNIAGQVLTFLGLIGVIVDPTTAGVGDSERALGYEEPWEDPEK
jgi:phi LC3 family holin